MHPLSHLLINSLLADTLHLTPSDTLLALTFGNLIDLDHLLVIAARSPGKLSWSFMKKELHSRRNHSVIQEPWFIVPVFFFSLIIVNMVPVIFFTLHIILDHLILHSEKRPLYPWDKSWKKYGLFALGSPGEWILDLLVFSVWLLRKITLGP